MSTELFEQVQKLLSANAAGRRSGASVKHPSLLVGMIHDAQGRVLTPTHACKGSRRYCYYATIASERDDTIRLPAVPVERAVVDAIATLLRSPHRLAQAWSHADGGELRRVMAEAERLGSRLADGPAQANHQILQAIDLKLVVSGDAVAASICPAALAQRLSAEHPGGADAERLDLPLIRLEQSRRRGLRLRLDPDAPRAPDLPLVQLIVRAHHARDRLASMQPQSGAEASAERRELSRLARLTYLAPNLIQAILDGRQPADLQARTLLRIADLPLEWQAQRRALGT